MRELLAAWMAILTGFLVCVLAIFFALIQNQAHPEGMDRPDRSVVTRSVVTSEDIDVELGRSLYVLLRCRSCHSVAGDGNNRNPLDGVGSRLDEEEIRLWILAPEENDPDIRKPDFTYLSLDQVRLLTKYMASLK